jgi:type IV pilus assembly protein PilP
MKFARFQYFLLVPIVMLLSACGDSSNTELKDWMEGVKKNTRIGSTKLSEPKVFVPVDYAGKDQTDPFDPAKLQIALAHSSSDNDKLKPDMDRRKEVLENFPLDTMKMVGTIEKQNLRVALIQVDKALYQAKVGNYMGQNFGMVTKITDSEIELKEVVQDPAGDWVERPAKLELQETQK